MIALAIALEVALSISQRHNGEFLMNLLPISTYTFLGFSVPQKNAFKFASQQFLTVRYRPVLSFHINVDASPRPVLRPYLFRCSFGLVMGIEDLASEALPAIHKFEQRKRGG